ncbi:MAG: hypothetical protein GY751_04570, partial [Bacteroidetes bacterium]|nr:hypothetical protein [Bacteroidota bacterium]
GWVSQEGGNVSGATTTVVNTIPTWGDTTGSSLLANDTAFLTTSGSATDFILESPSATGLAGMSLKDSSDSLQLTVEYAESADRSQILDYSGSGLDFGSDVGLMSCRSTSATDMFVDIETPDPFSGGSGLRVKASGGSNKVELLYDEAADESLLRDQSTAGLEIATDARVLIESTADHDAELMTWGTTGTSGSAFDIHVGNQDPNTIVTGSGGDMYHSVTGATSAIYCHDGASPSNNDWKPLLKGPSSATTAKSLAYFTDTSGTNVDSHPQMTLWDGLDHINLNLFGADTAATAQIGCWDSTESIGSFLNWVGVSEFGELDINESGVHAKSGVNDSFLNVASKSVSGSAVIRLIDSSDDDKFILQYAESTGTLQMDATEDLKFNMSSGAGVNIVTASPNTKAPLALETSGTGGASNSIFLSDVTPVGAITGSPGDACFKADDGVDSNMYIHKGTGSNNTDWERVHTGRLPIFKSYSIGTVKERGVHYYAGFYDASEDDTTLTIGGTTTETYGDSNRAEGAHAFCVASGAGGTDLVLTVSGTSITDAGVRTTSDSEVIVSDADAATTDQYFETTKKWLGIVTYTLTGASGSFTFNYGFAKYEDFNNKDFDTEGIEFVCLANKATTVDIEYLYHSDQGWTYSSDSFIPGGNTICSLSTDYSTDNNIDVDAYAAYKRSNLTQEVEGTSLEGVLIRLTTVTGDAITRGDIHLLVNADII